MSHQIHHTEAFVLGSANTGEANKYIILFTRELGTVGATAQSVRGIASKLRYSLQDFSYTHVDLVRGKHSWRLTNARRLDDLAPLTEDPRKLKVYAKLLTYIRRLAAHEEVGSALFDLALTRFRFLADETLTVTELEDFELATLLAFLGALGYLRDFSGSTELAEPLLTHESLSRIRAERAKYIHEAELALAGSQL